MKVPDILGDDPDPFRIDFLLLKGDCSGALIAALQVQGQALHGSGKEDSGKR